LEIIQCSLPPNGTIIDSGDYHVGAMNCHQGAIKAMVRRAMDDGVFLINKGDSIEAILPHDKRFAFCGRDKDLPTPASQRDWLIETFRPVRDKILAWGIGNHEFKLINTLNVGKEVADGLGVPFGGYSYVLNVEDGKKARFKILATHGCGSLGSAAKDPIQRDGNRKASLKLKLDRTGFRDCMVMTMGHTHQSVIAEPTIEREVMLTTKGGKIHHTYRAHTDQGAAYIPPEARWYLNSPSFLSTYSAPGSGGISYSEVAMYAPAEIGWLEIDYQDYMVTNVRKVHV